MTFFDVPLFFQGVEVSFDNDNVIAADITRLATKKQRSTTRRAAAILPAWPCGSSAQGENVGLRATAPGR